METQKDTFTAIRYILMKNKKKLFFIQDGSGHAGAESLASVLAQCTALAHLNLRGNRFGDAGAESLAGVLAQCPALTHLNLRRNKIGDAGAKSFAGVLAHCSALAHLDLSGNHIHAVGGGRLRASWRGQASGLLTIGTLHCLLFAFSLVDRLCAASLRLCSASNHIQIFFLCLSLTH